MGGDEININDLKDDRIKNFGWPISSYVVNIMVQKIRT